MPVRVKVADLIEHRTWPPDTSSPDRVEFVIERKRHPPMEVRRAAYTDPGTNAGPGAGWLLTIRRRAPDTLRLTPRRGSKRRSVALSELRCLALSVAKKAAPGGGFRPYIWSTLGEMNPELEFLLSLVGLLIAAAGVYAAYMRLPT